MNSLRLLPLPDSSLQLLSIYEENERIQLIVKPSNHSASCPNCQSKSSRIHSRYKRKIQDLPMNDKEVELLLFTRKWFCESIFCKTSVFSERYTWLSTNKRRTIRAEEMLRKLAFSTRCLSAEKLARSLHLPASHDTLLNLIHKTPDTKEVSPFCRN